MGLGVGVGWWVLVCGVGACMGVSVCQCAGVRVAGVWVCVRVWSGGGGRAGDGGVYVREDMCVCVSL